jgi:hypothetical protein
MVEKNVKGGQFPDGSQKDGFLKYENHKPAGIYDIQKEKYILFSENNLKAEADGKIGEMPEAYHPWKELVKDPERDEKLKEYFSKLNSMESIGAKLAKEYLKHSKEIGEKLVSDGVANSAEDVNGVLMNGFFHLYGPINDFI